MLFKLTHTPLCLFRNKRTVLKLGRVISCRLEDSSRNYWTSPVQERTVSRCIAMRTKLLENHTWMVHKVPKRNFLQREPENKPVLKSNPKKDGLPKNRYELIYVNDRYLVYKRSADLVLAVSLIALPFLCYLIYTDTETKDVDFSKPMEIPTKYLVCLGFAVYMSLFLRGVATLRRSPYRMYKLRDTHGFDTQYVAILPDRTIFTKKLPFSLGEYKELPEPLGFMHKLLHGNTYIKDKSYMIFEDCFVSPHYHNELNGFL